MKLPKSVLAALDAEREAMRKAEDRRMKELQDAHARIAVLMGQLGEAKSIGDAIVSSESIALQSWRMTPDHLRNVDRWRAFWIGR